MKVLLDTCICAEACVQVKTAGHDVIWGGEWKEDPGDEAILAQAARDGRVLVTLDKDFGELAVRMGARHCGILRLVGFKSSQQGSVCLHILKAFGEDLKSSAIITAEPGRVRIRRPAPSK